MMAWQVVVVVLGGCCNSKSKRKCKCLIVRFQDEMVEIKAKDMFVSFDFSLLFLENPESLIILDGCLVC